MDINKTERGQGLLEYALILSLVFLIVIIVVAVYGEAVVALYRDTILPLVEALTGD